MLSSLRSPAQVEKNQGFLPQPEKDLESRSSTPLEARFPYHDSRAMRRSPSPCPWRPDFRGTTGVSLSSPSYLVRNPNQALHLEKTHETPPSSRDEGLFSCMARKTIPSHLSKLHRRLHSLYATQWAPRDTRRDSTGERSPFFPLKTRPDSPGESRMQP